MVASSPTDSPQRRPDDPGAPPRRERRGTGVPFPLTSFVGRAREVAQVVGLLRQGDVRLVTLTGPGGVGKTRLALRVADEAAEAFPGGVAFVSLASIHEPGLVGTAIAHALGLRDEVGSELSVRLRYVLRDSRLLLLLDNFEHVTAAAPEIAELLGACPGLKALVTSRAVLHLSGEQHVVVAPLALPDLARLPSLEQIVTFDAVRLFVQRAKAANAEFALTDANTVAVASICRRLDGLPLALELAAARLAHLSPAGLLARLDRRLPLLTGGPLDHPPRLQTMRSAIAWSHDLLEAPERRLFRCLSVFSGGCTLAAAAAVCGPAISDDGEAIESETVLDAIASLVDKSLVWTAEQADGEPRFQMLESIGEFAQEELAACGEADEARRRHATYFLALAEEGDTRLRGHAQLTWMRRLAGEQTNVRAALGWCTRQPDGAIGLRLAGALHWFWSLHGDYDEGLAWLDAALALTAADETPFRVRALNGAGVLALLEGDHREARVRLDAARALAESLGDTAGLAAALHFLGALALFHHGDAPRARSLVAESVERFREVGDPWGEAQALCTLGLVGVVERRPAEARPPLEAGLKRFRALGDGWGVSRSLINLGELARIEGAFEEAEALYEACLHQVRELGHPSTAASVLNNLGHMAQHRGDFRVAAERFREGLIMGRQHGEMRAVAHCLAGLAGTAGLLGELVCAARLYGAVDALLEEIGATMWPIDRAEVEQCAALVRDSMGDADFAAAKAAGRAMPLEEAIAAALAVGRRAERAARLRATPSEGERLTPREGEILRLLVEGRSDREIAATLSISHRTVARHVAGIFTKLGVSNRTAAATLALRRGLA